MGVLRGISGMTPGGLEGPAAASGELAAPLRLWAAPAGVEAVEVTAAAAAAGVESGSLSSPARSGSTPGKVCALLAAILAHGCNLGLYRSGVGRALRRNPSIEQSSSGS